MWNSFLEKLNKAETTTILKLQKEIALLFQALAPHIIQPEQEAWWLLQHIFSQTTEACYNPIFLNEHSKNTLKQALLERVFLKKPLAYILGNVTFCDLTIKCVPPILIPRPETEDIVLEVIKQLQKLHTEPVKILDLCSGSGCISLALAAAFPNFFITGVDIDPTAISLAEKNQSALNLKNVTFIESNLFEQLPNQKFDIIISNPPYICPTQKTNLSEEVSAWESPLALFAEENGLALYKSIISNCHNFLTFNQGLPFHLILEISPEQETFLNNFINKNLHTQTQIFVDIFGRKRALLTKITSMILSIKKD